MNILFVCSRNKWRSRTAETLFKNKNGIKVKSAGTEPAARIRLNWKLVEWADVIFVMEKKHKQRLMRGFQSSIDQQEIIVLDIPDNYQYMDEELIALLEDSVNYYLEGEEF